MKVRINSVSDTFGQSYPQNSRKISLKHRFLGFFERNYIQVIRVLLLFHRIIGISFGGLVIDTNGKTSVNRFYKIYGYLVFILLLSYDLYHFSYFSSNYEKIYEYLNFKGLPKILPFLLASIGIVWNGFKLACYYYFNKHGYGLAMILVKMMNNQVKSMISFKTLAIILTWLTGAIKLIAMATCSFDLEENLLDQNTAIIQSCITFTLFWSLASITWIISFTYSNTLDEMVNQLRIIIDMRSGKLYFDVY